MKKVRLTTSPLLSKKMRVHFPDGRHVDFGARGYSDYTMHKDPVRRTAYLKRHVVREDWTDMYTSGFWARWLLWEKPTLKEAKAYMARRFSIQFLL